MSDAPLHEPSAAPQAPVEPPPRRPSPAVAFLRRHPAPLVFLGALFVLLPRLDYGLWDPWETHYAEVARRITVDGDWVTLHWGNADSDPAEVRAHPRTADDARRHRFFSKPILTFWLMALSFLALGVGEFAARLPIVLLAAGAIAGVFFYLRRLAGDRAALLSAALLLLTPMWAMLARHAITDVPFVAPLAVGTLAFAAVLFDPRTDARHAYVGYVCLALATLAKGLLGFLLPGAVLLATLFVTAEARGLRFAGTDLRAVLDAAAGWLRGAGNALRRRGSWPAPGRTLWAGCAAAGVVAAVVLGGALAGRLSAGRAGLRWGAAAAAALVGIVAVLAAHRERRARLNLALGVPLFVLLCATWYLPVILRNGMAFVREFILLHHFGRVSSGLGLDTTGLDIHDGTAGYYLQQLGYSLFPWIVVLPAAAVAWLRSAVHPPSADVATADADAAPGPSADVALLALVLAWAAVPYVLFTLSAVKFHHYIFPALPALAIVAGVGLDRLLRRGLGRWEAAGLLLGGVLLAAAWRELAHDPDRLIRLFSYRYTRRFPEPGWMRGFLGAALGLATAGGVGALAAAWCGARRAAGTPPGRLERSGAAWLAGTVLLGSAALAGAATWGQLPGLAPWISQHDAFAALDAQSRRPGDRLVSWADNWRGEVFYSRDRVTVIEPGDKQADSKLRGILRTPGRVFFVTTDAGGLRAALARAVGAAAARDHFRVLTRPGAGGFDAALYDGPAAGTYEPRAAALPPGAVAPAGAGGGAVVLREPQGPGRLTLAGVQLGAARVRRGGTLRVDLWFRCDAPAARDWEVFLHLDGLPPSRKPRAGNGDHGFTAGAVPTSRCRPGELLLDRWDLDVASDVDGGTYQLFAGLWLPATGDRMVVDPADAARSPGAAAGTLAAEYAGRAYVGDVVVTE